MSKTKNYKVVNRRAKYHRRKVKSPPAKASKYLLYLPEYIKKYPSVNIVLYCRVSGRIQDYKGNLETQKNFLLKKSKEQGLNIIACCKNVCSGWVLSDDRRGLLKAVDIASKYPNAIIVALSTDRFLRNEKYTNKQQNIIPTDLEFKKLKELTRDTPLATYFHPDTPPKEIRGHFSRLGQKAKGKKGGHPGKPGYMARRYKNKFQKAKKLKLEGKSYREIGERIGVPHNTVFDWLKKDK